MSHFTTVKTKIDDLGALRAALDKLKVPYTLGLGEPATVLGYMGQTLRAELSAHVVPGAYDIGFARGPDGCYEIVADWWGVETETGRTQGEVTDEVSREYALARVQAALAEAGYAVEGEPEWNKDTQEYEVVACRWS